MQNSSDGFLSKIIQSGYTILITGGVLAALIAVIFNQYFSPQEKEFRDKFEWDRFVLVPGSHSQKIKSFWMGRYEVTASEFMEYCKPNCPEPEPDGTNQGEYPVTKISYNDAMGYTAWLSRKLRRTVRLPTDLEWIHACRVSGGKYPWGDDGKVETAQMFGGFQDSNSPKPVGSKEPTGKGKFRKNVSQIDPKGVYDLGGNVWEWVARSPLNDAEAQNQIGTQGILGGGYGNEPPGPLCDLDTILPRKESAKMGYTGFRVLIEAEEGENYYLSSDPSAPKANQENKTTVLPTDHPSVTSDQDVLYLTGGSTISHKLDNTYKRKTQDADPAVPQTIIPNKSRVTVLRLQGWGFNRLLEKNDLRVGNIKLPVIAMLPGEVGPELFAVLPFGVAKGERVLRLTVDGKTAERRIKVSGITDGLSWERLQPEEARTRVMTFNITNNIMRSSDNNLTIIVKGPADSLIPIEKPEIQGMKLLPNEFYFLIRKHSEVVSSGSNFLSAAVGLDTLYPGEKFFLGVLAKGNINHGDRFELRPLLRDSQNAVIPLTVPVIINDKFVNDIMGRPLRQPLVGEVTIGKEQIDKAGNFQVQAFFLASIPNELPEGPVQMEVSLSRSGTGEVLETRSLALRSKGRREPKLTSGALQVVTNKSFYFQPDVEPDFSRPERHLVLRAGDAVTFYQQFSVFGVQGGERLICDFSLRNGSETFGTYQINGKATKGRSEYDCSIQIAGLPEQMVPGEYRLEGVVSLRGGLRAEAKPVLITIEPYRSVMEMATWPAAAIDIPPEYTGSEQRLFYLAHAITRVRRGEAVCFAADLAFTGIPPLPEDQRNLKISVSATDNQGVTWTATSSASLKELNRRRFVTIVNNLPEEFKPGQVSYIMEVKIGDFVQRGFNGFELVE